MKKKYIAGAFILGELILAGISCADGHAGNEIQTRSTPVKDDGTMIVQPRDTTISVNGRAVDIQYPKGKAAGSILCLPGWNFSRADVCEKSDFCEKAKGAGYVLILPEMGKSIYASQLYKETRDDWRGYPQLKFITDSMIPFLQKNFSLLKQGDNNFLYGISTGARGVAVIALNTDTLFKAGAALSGDYNQTTMYTDNLMIGYNGPFSKFKDRWETDNPYFSASKIKVNLYLAHGGKDKVVPTEQTKIFYDQLVKLNRNRTYKLHIAEDAEHNYAFWGGETGEVLKFFDACTKK